MDMTFRPTDISFASAQLVVTHVASIGTITANANTRFLVPVPALSANGRVVPVKASFACRGIALDSDGTLLASFIKRDNQGTPADVTLSGTKSLEVDYIALVDKAYDIPFTATLTDAQRSFKQGDAMIFNVLNNSAAIDTQPTQAQVTVVWAIIRP